MFLRTFCLAGLLLSACLDAPLPSSAPPRFVTPRAATPMGLAPILLRQGEEMIWQVTWHGQRIGIARLGVLGEAGHLRVESRFQTTGLADQMHPVHYHLVTPWKPALRIDNLHSALGRLRSWAATPTGPGRLQVSYADRVFQVDFAEPTLDDSLEQRTLRVEGQARAGEVLIDMTIWLSADSDRRPLRMTLARDGKEISATLLKPESES